MICICQFKLPYSLYSYYSLQTLDAETRTISSVAHLYVFVLKYYFILLSLFHQLLLNYTSLADAILLLV